MWSEQGRHELLHVAASSAVKLASVCVNETLSTSLEDVEFAADLASRLDPVLSEVPLVVVLPLLETSDLRATDESAVASSVDLFAQRIAHHGARLVLELGVPADDAKRFVDDVVIEDVGICYDVGNATALGFDVPAELRLLGDRVRHLHAKDKDDAGQNVQFGTGDVNFDGLFAELAASAYDGLVTMEATRGEDPVATADAHRTFLLSVSRPDRDPAEDAG
jgi:sugar phosphate isomerase/epimerase